MKILLWFGFWRFCFGPSLEILFWSELKRFKFGLGWERFWFGLGLGGFGLVGIEEVLVYSELRRF